MQGFREDSHPPRNLGIRGPDVARMLTRPLELIGALIADASTESESMALAKAIRHLVKTRAALNRSKNACVTWMNESPQ